MKRLNKTVQAGQVWSDTDPRQAGRTLRVVEVIGMFADCEILTDRTGIKRPQVGRRVRLRLDRFWPGPRGCVLQATEPNTDDPQ